MKGQWQATTEQHQRKQAAKEDSVELFLKETSFFHNFINFS
jgi:hypothetical protein